MKRLFLEGVSQVVARGCETGLFALSSPDVFIGDPEYKHIPGFPLKACGNDKLYSKLRMLMKLLLVLFCLLAPCPAWAAPAQEGELLVKDLSSAIEEYKAIDHGLSNYDVVLRRDPMQALVDESGNIVSPAGLHDGLTVQGVIRSKDFKSVLVDDEFYAEGDMIGPFRVVEIKENGFVAEEEGKKIFVPLYSENSAPANPKSIVSQ